MRNHILIIAIIFSIAIGCKSKKSTNAVPANTATEQTPKPAKTLGKVSHQFRATGCATVIVVTRTGQEEPLILIPKDSLPSELDVDGKEIYFNYRTLKIHQPQGCSKGIPAEVTGVERK